MKIFPEEARNWFKEVINWLENKACARKSGLGTNLPWDKEWLVETLSDSTIYMAFYTIAHLIKNRIPLEELSPNFFDFVFLGKGDGKEEWKKMREEFTYWYPVDFRNSAKELIPNHLTFFIFHHTAIFPRKFWPRIIGVNGMINIEGKKMSKSKGIFITMKQVLEWYGADATRFSLMNLAEGMEDVDFRRKEVENSINHLKNFYNFVLNWWDKGEEREMNLMDRWLIARLQFHIKEALNAYEETRFKTAIQHSFFSLWKDLKWYLKRCEKPNKNVLKKFIRSWILLICPVVPHICEELWEKIGGEGFASLARMPSFEKDLLDERLLEKEENFRNCLEDIAQIIKLVGKKKKLYMYVKTEEEFEYFEESKEFLKKRFGFEEVNVFKSDDPRKYDPLNKSEKAEKGKPALYLE